jgi:hypothetical protein
LSFYLDTTFRSSWYHFSFKIIYWRLFFLFLAFSPRLPIFIKIRTKGFQSHHKEDCVFNAHAHVAVELSVLAITQWQKTKHRATHTLNELLSRKITEIYTITTKMASPTHSGVVALNERTLNSFTCFTWSTMIQYTWMHHWIMFIVQLR